MLVGSEFWDHGNLALVGKVLSKIWYQTLPYTGGMYLYQLLNFWMALMMVGALVRWGDVIGWGRCGLG